MIKSHKYNSCSLLILPPQSHIPKVQLSAQNFFGNQKKPWGLLIKKTILGNYINNLPKTLGFYEFFTRFFRQISYNFEKLIEMLK